jgi:hypothetical protein
VSLHLSQNIVDFNCYLVNTQAGVIYNSDFTFQLTAGTGVFNGSLVDPFLTQLTHNDQGHPWIPYLLMVGINDFTSNPTWTIPTTPIGCSGDNCTAYLLPGGLESTTPWPPTDFPDSPIVEILDAPAVQLEFIKGVDPSDQFLSSDCDVIGDTDYLVALEICLTKSQKYPNSFISRKVPLKRIALLPTKPLIVLIICANGTSVDGSCLNYGNVTTISTTFSVYKRVASTINSRSNMTIMAISDLGSASQVSELDVTALKKGVNWLLDYKASDIPVTSSLAFRFWSSTMQISTPFWAMDEYRAFTGLLALPMWFFQANNYGNPDMNTPSPDKMVTYLPPEFTATADISRPYNKIKINQTMLTAYVMLTLLALAFSWIVILVILVRQKPSPRTSSYPLIDFAGKTSQVVTGDIGGIQAKLVKLTGADDRRIRHGLKETKILLRACDAVEDQNEFYEQQGRRHSSLVLVSKEIPQLKQIQSGMKFQ